LRIVTAAILVIKSQAASAGRVDEAHAASNPQLGEVALGQIKPRRELQGAIVAAFHLHRPPSTQGATGLSCTSQKNSRQSKKLLIAAPRGSRY
jgi:hypothetical protein